MYCTQDGEYAVHIAVRVEKGLEKMRLLLQGNAERNAVRLVSSLVETSLLSLLVLVLETDVQYVHPLFGLPVYNCKK